MLNNTSPALPTFDVLVESHVGLITVEVQAPDYMTAYKAAVEQLLIDPHGTVRHELDSRLQELGWQPA